MRAAPAKSRSRLLPGVLLVAMLGFGGGAWWLLGQRSVVAGYLPERPDLGPGPVVFKDRLAAADAQARGYFRPVAGLVAVSRLYHANGLYPEALACYEGLRELEPKNARWAHLAACILAEFGRLDEALPLEQRAVELQPDYLPARLRWGDILLKNNQVPASAEVYAGVLKIEPGNPYALLGLARGAISQGDWSRGAEHLRVAVRHHPDFIGALSLLVTVAEHEGNWGEIPALKAAMGRREFSDLIDPWLVELVEECHDAYRLSVAAAVAYAGGDVAAAHRHLARAIELAPTKGAYHRQRATFFTREGNLAKAREHLEKAVALTPEDADSWVFLVQNLNELGEMERAEQVLTKALAACPLSPSLHLERARWWKKVGRPDEAIAEYRESYRLRPNEASPLVELAAVYFSVGRVDEAVAALREALQKQPGHPIAQVTLALVAISQGDEAGARGWWNRVQLQPETPPQAAETVRQAYQQQFGRALP